MTEFVFNKASKPLTSLPTPETAIQLARKVIKDIPGSWKKGTIFDYNGGVTTYSTRMFGEKFFARISSHEQPFEWFKAGLLEEHTKHEMMYIKELESYVEVDTGDSPWQGVIAHYRYPPPLSDREIPEWILSIQPDPEVNEFFIISVPADTPISPSCTRGCYASVEHLIEHPDGKTRWTMAVAGEGGGIIPIWIQNMALPSAIARDVPSYIDWSKKKFKSSK
ncbi:hypothetical protein V1512DRAFT_118099 [Lipomyces arxii]|uniref:uncharacterized protein n=1 Tax=Lipomyces arxii TaxID=56418 RepID=UPI0034CFE7D4